MKKKQRKTYTAAFKVKIALEAIKGQRTTNEIATHYGVHLSFAKTSFAFSFNNLGKPNITC